MSDKMKRVGRKLSYQGKILEVYNDKMLIDNKEADWDFIHLKGGAAVVPVLPDGRIVMVRQYRNAIDSYSLEIPGGIYDADNESGEDCVRRELKEETGYSAENVEWLIHTHSLIAFTDEKVEIYVATGLTSGTVHLDEEEDLIVECYSVEELKNMIFDGEITDSKTVAGIMAYISKQTSI